MSTWLLFLIGFGSGLLAAGGLTALSVGLGIINRYAGLTGTGKKVWIYEDAVFFGGIGGTCLLLLGGECFQGQYEPVGVLCQIVLAAMGLGFGIFLGGWILALAEILNIFPVFLRRIGVQKGTGWIVAAVAAGKSLGSFWYFYNMIPGSKGQ